jgi:transcription elongation factor GreB
MALMSKAFVKEEGDAEDDAHLSSAAAPKLPAIGKNYITPAGYARLEAELRGLVEVERPEVVKTVAWAASLGDRSENADYIYGKRRLREIDRRVRFLIKRLEAAEVVDSAGRDSDQVFFGATVKLKDKSITIVGIDETDSPRNRISWISPVARALIKAREGDKVMLKTPGGIEELEILEVRYDPID